jgi:preprotein translocase subunit SecG
MQILNIFHVLIAVALIAFVLIQRGQGATAGAAFGSGASGTVFGARGAGNFLSRSTWVLAALFCAISLAMAVMVSRMMDEPQADLGVVASSQPAEETVQTLDAPPAAAQPSLSDLPAADPTVDDLPVAGSSDGEPVPAADDLPAVDGPEEMPDPAAGDG